MEDGGERWEWDDGESGEVGRWEDGEDGKGGGDSWNVDEGDIMWGRFVSRDKGCE